MSENQINPRRAPLPKQQRLPSDPFRYGGIAVVLAAAAAMVLAIMLREPAGDVLVSPVRATDLPQVN